MPSGQQQNELVQLQSQISAEIGRDAPAIAQGIFGDNSNHPDMTSLPNDQLDQLYVQKYQQGDRQWLQSEAQRDPQQFLDVAKRIGVVLPQGAPPGATQSPPPDATDPNAMANMLATATGQAAAPAPAPGVSPGSAPAPAAPVALPAPPPAPVAGPVAPSVPSPVPAAPAPLILGPNGQPLPPSSLPGM